MPPLCAFIGVQLIGGTSAWEYMYIFSFNSSLHIGLHGIQQALFIVFYTIQYTIHAMIGQHTICENAYYRCMLCICSLADEEVLGEGISNRSAPQQIELAALVQ